MAIIQFAIQDQEQLICPPRKKKSVSITHPPKPFSLFSLCFFALRRREALTIINQHRNHLRLRPLRLRIILLRQPIPPALVRDGDLSQIVVEHGLVEVDDEAFDDVGDLGEGGLLRHLLLDGGEGGFVDAGLGFGCISIVSIVKVKEREREKIEVLVEGRDGWVGGWEGKGKEKGGRQTIIVKPALGIVSDSEIDVDVVHLLVDLLCGPKSHSLLCHD